MELASLDKIIATRARTTFGWRINFDQIALDNVARMQSWCEANCTGLWRSQTHHVLYFQFDTESDATMFMLRWGGAEGNRLK